MNTSSSLPAQQTKPSENNVTKSNNIQEATKNGQNDEDFEEDENLSDHSGGGFGSRRALKKAAAERNGHENGHGKSETFSYSSSSNDDTLRAGKSKEGCGASTTADKLLKTSLTGNTHHSNTVADEVELKIVLPDKSLQTLNIRRDANAHEVYQMLVERIALEPEFARYFYLFEIIDSSFGTHCFYHITVPFSH